MSAVFKPADCLEARFEPMTHANLVVVDSIEQSAYKYPWTCGNFSDSLNSGYLAQMLLGGQDTLAASAPLLGYFVAMKGVDEVHLLNITVAPAYQLQGWGRLMLDALALWSRGQGAQWLWLEVRVSNAHAKALYMRYGFRAVGLRKGYYPEGGTSLLGGAAREDAVVMSLALSASAS
jgi:ribosomal-protein-alanine N-acetyltransferase